MPIILRNSQRAVPERSSATPTPERRDAHALQAREHADHPLQHKRRQRSALMEQVPPAKTSH